MKKKRIEGRRRVRRKRFRKNFKEQKEVLQALQRDISDLKRRMDEIDFSNLSYVFGSLFVGGGSYDDGCDNCTKSCWSGPVYRRRSNNDHWRTLQMEKLEMIKETSKCEERIFTCPYCDGEGLVGTGWYPDKEVIVYTGSKHECSQCEGTGK